MLRSPVRRRPALKTLLVNASFTLAILILIIIAATSVLLLVRGITITIVPEAPDPGGEPVNPEIVTQPYPAAAIPLLGSLLSLFGLLRNQMILAWIGLAVLLVFSLLFLFSTGAALLPAVLVLLVLLLILQRNRRSV